MDSYEKKYKEALERAKNEYQTHKSFNGFRGMLAHIFPELCESEDEKVRKMLIKHLYQERGSMSNDEAQNALAWLEKQGEQKNKINSCKITFEDVLALECSMKTAKITEGGDELYEMLVPLYNKIHNAYLAGKQSEQKLPIEKLPEEMKTIGESLGFTTQEECDEYNQMVSDLIMSGDKVEPKFKVGDWVVDNEEGDFLVITKVRDNTYRIVSQEGEEFDIQRYVMEYNYHKFTIQDARDGNVLAGSKNDVILIFRGIGNTEWDDVIDYYCRYDCYQKEFIVQKDLEFWGYIKDNQLKPATKEQCVLLFQKMKEAGYEWDDEKKVLNKIDENITWSENDEKAYASILNDLKQNVIPDEDDINWLKSIKQRLEGEK